MDDYPKNRVVAIQLRYIPYYHFFRYKKMWWYHIPACESPENAILVNSEVERVDSLRMIPSDTIIATHIDEVPKKVMHLGKMIY